jgi:hypothetical protein
MNTKIDALEELSKTESLDIGTAWNALEQSVEIMRDLYKALAACAGYIDEPKMWDKNVVLLNARVALSKAGGK